MMAHKNQRGPAFRPLQPLLVLRCLDSCLGDKIGNIYVLRRNVQRDASIVMGPHWPGVLVTICLILGGSTLNLQVVEVKLSSPHRERVTLAVYALALLTLGLLLKTTSTDPGIIYPDACPTLMRQGSDGGIEIGSATNAPSAFLRQTSEPMMFCDLCDMYVPERLNSRHCPDCNVCLEGMDHHCPWMGMCVARKNMKW